MSIHKTSGHKTSGHKTSGHKTSGHKTSGHKTSVRAAKPGLFPDPSLSAYLQQIHSYPLLGRKEEIRLIRRWHDHQDENAADRLVTSHLRLVSKIAMGYRGYGLPVCDLISEGSVGMMQAINKFDPDRGFRLSTYAMWWIRAAIKDYVMKSWSLVKLGTTAAQKKLFFNLRRTREMINSTEQGDLEPEHLEIIASRLGVSEKAVIHMNRRLGGPDPSLNIQLHDDAQDEWLDRIMDSRTSQETRYADDEEMSQRRELLTTALKALNARELDILTERRLRDNPVTLEDLSKSYGVSRERIRQIEARAFEKISSSIRSSSHYAGLTC